MRVIAGSLKGRRLQAPPPEDLSIRPTSDRAREALFSILQRWPKGGFLDLFGGTGAVALEAWSRGYGPVRCVEKDPRALALARVNARGTAVEVIAGDALGLSPALLKDVEVVFADPPYAIAREALERLGAALGRGFAPGGILVFEAPADEVLGAPAGWILQESRRYGAAVFHFLIPSSPSL